MRQHLEESGYTYFEHMKRSLSFSLRFAIGSLKCFVHGIIPDVFVTSATDIAQELKEELLSD
ncbi:MAG: DUF6356 family protein [Candidatus Thorarchaeota archaeon]|jgi:uncharacterized PurR-regulated membrane protein YhhQ (DUF165 family)